MARSASNAHSAISPVSRARSRAGLVAAAQGEQYSRRASAARALRTLLRLIDMFSWEAESFLPRYRSSERCAAAVSERLLLSRAPAGLAEDAQTQQLRTAQGLDIEGETSPPPRNICSSSVDTFSERALTKHVDSTVLSEQVPRGRAPAGQQLKQQLRENSTPNVVRVRVIAYCVRTSPITHTSRCAHRSLDLEPIYGAQATLLAALRAAAQRPRPAQHTRIADGATRDPGACCKSCYPRSTSTTRCAASCCQHYVLKYNRWGATSR